MWGERKQAISSFEGSEHRVVVLRFEGNDL